MIVPKVTEFRLPLWRVGDGVMHIIPLFSTLYWVFQKYKKKSNIYLAVIEMKFLIEHIVFFVNIFGKKKKC